MEIKGQKVISLVDWGALAVLCMLTSVSPDIKRLSTHTIQICNTGMIEAKSLASVAGNGIGFKEITQAVTSTYAFCLNSTDFASHSCEANGVV